MSKRGQKMNLNILFEDEHIIIVEKPPKVPSQQDPSGDPDLLSLLKEHLIKTTGEKDPYVAVVHRLDRPVGGVMVYPKTKLACADLNKQIQDKKMKKTYYCVACGQPPEAKGVFKDYLQKLSTSNMSKVVRSKTPKAKEAILEYELLNTVEREGDYPLSLLKINLITGRHHQIRAQLSHHRMPLWGDTKYNRAFGRRGVWTQVALFARELSFVHPKTKKEMHFQLDLPQVEPFDLVAP